MLNATLKNTFASDCVKVYAAPDNIKGCHYTLTDILQLMHKMTFTLIQQHGWYECEQDLAPRALHYIACNVMFRF